MTAIALPTSFAPTARRAWHILTRPLVVLGLILLAMLLYLVMTPLLIMIQTTITWQIEDQRLVRGMMPGEFTLFH